MLLLCKLPLSRALNALNPWVRRRSRSRVSSLVGWSGCMQEPLKSKLEPRAGAPSTPVSAMHEYASKPIVALRFLQMCIRSIRCPSRCSRRECLGVQDATEEPCRQLHAQPGQRSGVSRGRPPRAQLGKSRQYRVVTRRCKCRVVAPPPHGWTCCSHLFQHYQIAL
jgi:hypothetical protein